MKRVVIRPVPSFPGYGAGSDGLIYSRRRRGRIPGLTDKWNLVKGCRARGGYLGVAPWVDGKGSYRKVHTMIAEAWHGPRPEGTDVHHVNCCRQDNRPENLIYLPRGVHLRLHKRIRDLQALDMKTLNENSASGGCGTQPNLPPEGLSGPEESGR